MNNIKYLAAYIVPCLTFIGILFGGFWVWATMIFAFFIVPITEPILQSSTKNYTQEEKSSRLSNKVFDVLLYLNIPIIFGLLLMFGLGLEAGIYSTIEITGLALSIGTTMGTGGINVAHELGHRDSKFEQFLSKLLLMPSYYMHFFIEHNRGHHKFVSTPDDPATARYKENLYAFWFRSIIGQYYHAWKLENTRLSRDNKSIFSLQNEMILFQIIQALWFVSLVFLFSFSTAIILSAIGIFSFLLLETINYVEHYGLMRTLQENGRYETVKNIHSWNSNHHLGRIILYELTRHSDHHFQANKKYQILEHHDASPQLPFGYPTSMLMSMVPPIWFSVMNKEVLKYQSYT